MKRWKLPPLITITISAQMIVSPFAYALGGMNTLEVVNMVGQAIQQNQQSIQAQRQAVANQQLIAQMTAPGPDKYFKDQLFSRIPGLYQYMAQNGINPSLNCTTLPTTLTEIKAEVCRIGVTNDRGVPPQAQLSEMYSLYKTYGDVSKVYENYRSNSNAEGQAFGVGCMRNAMQTINGFLTSRINDLDKLMMNVGFINDKFKEASKVDLDAIAEATAVLDGGNSELTDEVRTKRPDLFDFGKRFNNPACKSMYEGDKINTIGRRTPGGLNAISKDMKNIFSAKAGGKFSGESYVGAHATVVEDINKMADNVAKQFNLNFSSISEPGAEGRGGYGQFLSGLRGSISSPSGLTSQFTNDFFADAQQSYNQEVTKINDDLRLLGDEMRAAGVDPSRAAGVARNLNANNFESEVSLVQNQLRNGCIQRAFGGESFWNDLKRNIKDPDASRFANKSYDNFRDRIQAIMTDPRTTPEAKIAAVRALERGEGSRFVLNMQSGYQRTTIGADGKAVTKNVSANSNAPSSYFNDVISTCDAQFNTNKLGSSLTAASAIQKLRNLNQQYKSLAQNQASKLRSEIRRKLIECETKTEANNQQAGSCTPDRFNTSAPGFCANGAFTCANNMKSCTAQAEQFVTQIKGERTLRVQKYKQNMEKNKNDIKNMVARVFQEYSQIGQGIAGLNLGAGFNFPSPDLNVSGEFLDKFRSATQNSPDGALLLEDPDKYVELMKKNVRGMKDAFTALQQSLTGRGGVLAQHIEQTDKNYREAQQKSENLSRECIAKHDDFVRESENQRKQMMAEQQKRMQEMGEKRQDFCSRFGMLSTNPTAGCDGNVAGTISAAGAAGTREAEEYSQICATSQQQNLNVQDICIQAGSVAENTRPDRNSTDLAVLCYTHSQLYVQGSTVCPPARESQNTNQTVVIRENNSRNGNDNGDTSTTNSSAGSSIDPGCKTTLEQRITAVARQANRISDSDTTSSAPSICTYNGDRFDGGSEPGSGSNPAEMFARILSQ